MKKYSSLLLVLILALTFHVPASHAAVVGKNIMTYEGASNTWIDLKIKPAKREVVNLIKIDRVKAGNEAAAQLEFDHNRSTVEYRRFTSGIRIRGLDAYTGYCFRGTLLFNKDYKPRSPLDQQAFDATNSTNWLCASTTTGLEGDVTADMENKEEVVTFGKDLLWYNIDVSRKPLKKTSNGSVSEGYLLELAIMNAGTAEVTGPVKTRVSCQLSTDRRSQGVINPTMRSSIPAGKAMKFRTFLTNDMLRLCAYDFTAEILFEDEVAGNNIFNFTVKQDDNGDYRVIR